MSYNFEVPELRTLDHLFPDMSNEEINFVCSFIQHVGYGMAFPTNFGFCTYFKSREQCFHVLRFFKWFLNFLEHATDIGSGVELLEDVTEWGADFFVKDFVEVEETAVLEVK